ncbi:TetR/AcrR family transcriptional regulator [Brachybacterium sp. UNK5269]|uniref:TetR/AcrR family transcriptional regulator n=1 Tax=Brachybacterium sp. UNK5269 TaxID=3408576 RepID=UPI003BAE7F9B
MSAASEIPRTLRDAQAALTREQIVGAAGRLFRAGGYARTSIGAIAAEAGVSVQTIYNSVGNKGALLSAVLDVAASGLQAPTPVAEFMQERVDRAGDAAAVIAVLADWFLEVNTSTAWVWSVIRQAAAIDDEAAGVQRARDEQRLHNYRLAAAALRARGALADITDEEAAATIWTIGHPETYRLLVDSLGLSAAAYREWVRKGLTGALAAG